MLLALRYGVVLRLVKAKGYQRRLMILWYARRRTRQRGTRSMKRSDKLSGLFVMS